VENLRQNDLLVEEIVADKGYSSGEALKALEDNNITGYIPNRSQFVYERPGFTYHSDGDYYSCPNNKKLSYKGTFETLDGIYNKEYRASRKECNLCPSKTKCSAYKKYATIINETTDKLYYQRMHIRMQTKKGKALMKRRQATVEPVIGTLVNYMGMKKVNTKGLEQANKCMTLSAVAYNIKKLMKHKSFLVQSKVKELQQSLTTAVNYLLNNFKPKPAYFNLTN
jgi:hypothetical protein